MVKIIECPRDAFQGIKKFIPTDLKVEYMQLLLQCGFDTLDFGSFVSPKAIPQMADTKEIVRKLNPSTTKLLSIVANLKGAEDAVQFENINYLGYPFSISETFQLRNTNRGIHEAFEDLKKINSIALQNHKEVVTYISMGFGNPYNDPYSPELACEWVEKLSKEGMKIFALSDTVGSAKGQDITEIFTFLIKEFPHLEFGAHFHSVPNEAKSKLEFAFNAGCRRFDSALMGIGGCPLASDDLTGNTATETLISFLESKNQLPGDLIIHNIREALDLASFIFNEYH